MRGIANTFGQSVQSDSVIAVERFLFLGHVPTVDLQQAFFQPGHVQLHDVLLTFLYTSHFFFPLAFAFALWLYDRRRYYRFIITLMGVSFAAFLTFFALPVAPPRFAFQYGEALPVADVMASVTQSVGWQGFDWIYRNLVGNPVAAFPSLHAAYPTIVLLFLAERSRRLALAWAPVMCAIWFGTVYLGHHYVVDVLGGIAYAVVGYLWVKRLMHQ
jgi:membrane-associated phospholipid phosphatase